jgi:hypothetical protein
MHVDEVELRIVRLPYKSVFKTSFAAESEKVAVIATVRSDGVEGYGEGVMDTLPSYREETIVGALHLLREALIPWLLANDCDDPATLCDFVEGLARQSDGQVHARARGVGLPRPPTRRATAHLAGRRTDRGTRGCQSRDEHHSRDRRLRSAGTSSRATSGSN